MKRNTQCVGKCPKCGSENITYGESFLEDDYYCYKGSCNDCGQDFKEWYYLVYTETVWEEENEDNEMLRHNN